MSVRCPCCGASSRPAFEVRGLAFRRCRACASLWVAEGLGRDAGADLYRGREYFANEAFGVQGPDGYWGYLDYMADRRSIEAKFAGVLAHVEAQASPGRLLDVGCGPGFMVATARARGWDAMGVDVNPWAVTHARQELDLDVREATLEGAGFDSGTFDAVTMMDLLEHSSRPAELIVEAARVTRPGGMLAVLTPDAGSPVSRLLGARWPEALRAPEHLVLFSARGLTALLGRAGYEVIGWHSVGKRSSLATLIADASPVAPPVSERLGQLVAGRRIGEWTIELDPRTKLCLYARLRLGRHGAGSGTGIRRDRAARLPKRAPPRAPEHAVAEDLATLARADRLADWMFDQFRVDVRGSVVEVGAGLGTYSSRILAAGAKRLMLVEPEEECASVLEAQFAADPRATVAREAVPGSVALNGSAGRHDLVVCQNVLEHLDDDRTALAEMARALKPGGALVLVVPAHPRLYGSLDIAYGHRRRYSPEALRVLLADEGLELLELRPFNLLGVLGWSASNRLRRYRLSPASVRLYERLLPGWRELEEHLRPPWGLSLVARARRPAGDAPSASTRARQEGVRAPARHVD